MTLHKLGTYRDGFKTITYCRVCGKENVSETNDCPAEPNDRIGTGAFGVNGNLVNVLDKPSELKQDKKID